MSVAGGICIIRSWSRVLSVMEGEPATPSSMPTPHSTGSKPEEEDVAAEGGAWGMTQHVCQDDKYRVQLPSFQSLAPLPFHDLTGAPLRNSSFFAHQ